MNCLDDLFVPTDMVSFSISGFHCTVHASLSIRQPFMDPASVCFHARIASSHQRTSKPVPLPLCLIGSVRWRMQSMRMKQLKRLQGSTASVPVVYQDEVPTEPATSPRSQIHEAPGSTRLVEELQLPSLEYGPRPEPERFATRYILNDGSMPQEAYEELMRKAAQSFNNRDMERERRRAEAAEYQAHQRSIQEWEAQIEARGLDNAAIPCGPAPAGTSSMRALPNVHAALRQNDPKMASFSQPAVKKAPPTSGRPMPSVFQSDAEPPRIGALPVQPPPPAAPRPVDASSARLPLAPTPMTPSHPPRPPIEALPKYPSMETSSCANKHPLEPPTAQAPPSKHVRCKAFPHSSQPQDQVYTATATVEMTQRQTMSERSSSRAYTSRGYVYSQRTPRRDLA